MEKTYELLKLLVVRGCFKTDRDYNIALKTFEEITGESYEELVDSEV